MEKTAMATKFNKTSALQFCYSHSRNAGFIANYFLNNGDVATLKAVAKLLASGREVSTLPYRLPEDVLVVDGEVVTPAKIRDMAKSVA
jgi:hypothetical protein